MTLTGVWGAFRFLTRCRRFCMTCLICPPAQISARVRLDSRMAPENARLWHWYSVEPRFGIRFVSSYRYGREAHQSRQIGAPD